LISGYPKDVYSEEEDRDDNEDTADEPEVELGPGVKRIRDNTDIDDMLDVVWYP
jgi:hypothetical protein